ncbi:hypothetical protein D9M71_162480 [compost metagenome]
MAGQRLGLAEQQVQRVHVAAAHVQQAAAVGVGADDALDVGAGEHLDLLVRGELLELALPGAQGLLLAGVEAHVAVAVAEVGVDGVLVDTRLDDLRALVADLEDATQTVLADVALDRLEVVADAGHHLAAVASGAAEADVAAFQHDDVGDAFLGQLERGVDAGEAAADHHDVRFEILF